MSKSRTKNAIEQVACGVLAPARPDIAHVVRLRNRRRGTMIALYDHIQELRAEWRAPT
jgi:hypothetical protein